ncbi:hypothetical protein MASR2M78_09080 [Treponema sp.]
MTKTLNIASFNAENFYLLLDQAYSREELEYLDDWTYQSMNTSIYNHNKSRRKITEIAAIILEQDFDLIGLCEIGGLESLRNFNRLYLDNRYECYLYEENSKRGIFVGALVKQELFPSLRALNMSPSFSRNLLKLELGKEGGNLEVFVLHLKSQYGDDHGIEQRIQEVKDLCTLVRQKKCIVMGDFNGVLIRGQNQFEFDSFLELPFYDVLAAVGIPIEERHTHYYFGNGPHFSQLDYIFCTHDIEVLEAEVLEDVVPQSWEERKRLPSDHLFIRARVEIE